MVIDILKVMSLLPILTSIVHRRSLIVILLFTIHFSLFTLTLTSSAFAAHTDNPVITDPNPQPCANPLYTNQFTKAVLQPQEFVFEKEGTDGQPFTLEKTFEVEIDFSKLSAIFASPNSNYLESKFQNEEHRHANIINSNSVVFNQFHGPGQKAAPKIMVDELKVKYVKYIYEHPHLPEADHKYTDINGQDPARIYDLITSRRFSYPPSPPEAGQDRTEWLATWGQYWEKIPTAVNEFYYGVFIFPIIDRLERIKEFEEKGVCVDSARRKYFVLPDYFRTTSIANQINQIIVPKEAQSSTAKFWDNTLASTLTAPKTALAKVIQKCSEFFSDTSLTKLLQKVVKISFNLVNPIKDVYARVPIPNTLPECPQPIPILPKDKKGSGPFCSFPAAAPDGTPQLESGEQCQNVQSSNKLDSGTLVKCKFKSNPFFSQRAINAAGSWDTCNPLPGNRFKCTLTIRAYPIFYVPWLAPIWNNTTYSDKEKDQIAVVNTPQRTGKPGILAFFKPKSVDSTVFPEGKNLPSKEQESAQEIKQRFFGAVDCAKEFTRNIALKPKALQDDQRISAQTICKITP